MDRSEYLTPGEQEALDAKGITKRAKTIQKFLYLAEQLNLVDEQVSLVVDRIRVADESEWKGVRKSIGNLSLFLSSSQPLSVEVGQSPYEMHVRQTPASASQELIDEVQPELLDRPVVKESVTDDLGEGDVPLPGVLAEAVQETPSTPDELLEEDPELLSENTRRWLNKVFNSNDTESLTVDDIEALERLLRHMRGPIGSNATLNYRVMVDAKLKGFSNKDIAGYVDSSEQSVSVALSNFMKNIKTHEGSGLGLRKHSNGMFEIVRESTLATEVPVRPIRSAAAAVAPVQKPVPRPPVMTLRPVRVIERQQVKEISAEERGEILRNAIENPQIVGPAEWSSAAHGRFIELGLESSFTDSQVAAYWNRIHFNDNNTHKQDLTDDARVVQDELQRRFVDGGSRGYFAENPRQNVAARMLLISFPKVNTLDEVCEKLRQKFGESLTNNVAQRHVVAAVIHLLDQGE